MRLRLRRRAASASLTSLLNPGSALVSARSMEVAVKAVRVHEYHADPRVDDIAEPKIEGPLDVIVKIGGAGVCRTDLHIMEGQWAERMSPRLPYVIGIGKPQRRRVRELATARAGGQPPAHPAGGVPAPYTRLVLPATARPSPTP